MKDTRMILNKALFNLGLNLEHCVSFIQGMDFAVNEPELAKEICALYTAEENKIVERGVSSVVEEMKDIENGLANVSSDK